jgi:hypothetical protein
MDYKKCKKKKKKINGVRPIITHSHEMKQVGVMALSPT